MERFRKRYYFEIIVKGKEFLVKLVSSQLTKQYYLADQIFDDQREDLSIVFVSFKIDDGIYDKVIRNLAVQGFSWMGDRYFYLTTKDIGKNKTYFCRQIDETIVNSYSLWNKIGSFHNLQSIPLIGMRLGLLVSSTYPGFSFPNCSEIEITLLSDIINYENSYNEEYGQPQMKKKTLSSMMICTEGSGFISMELAHEHSFPRYISQGIPIKPCIFSEESHDNTDDDDQNELQPPSSKLAAAYQVRVLCSYGLFKGTLIVDPFLTGKQIILRESMKKLPPPPPPLSFSSSSSSHSNPQDAMNYAYLSIVNSPPPPSPSTACHSSHHRYYHDNHQIIQNFSCIRKCCGCPLPSGHLNRHLILILHQSYQIPLQIFQELVRESFQYSHSLSVDKSSTLSYCHNSSIPLTYSDTPITKLSSFLSHPSPIHNSGVIETLLLCGYELNHPLLSSLISKIQKNLLNQFLQCRLRCHGTCHLMGLPDPTQTLATNEIFIPGWSSCQCYQNSSFTQFNSFSLHEILVSRFPLHSSFGILKMKLVNDCFGCVHGTSHYPLVHYFNPHGYSPPKEAGIIIFGSNPHLSSRYSCPAVSHLNGDYDGDLYWVCTDRRLVENYSQPLNQPNTQKETSMPRDCPPYDDLNQLIEHALASLDREEDNFDEIPPLIQSHVGETSSQFHSFHSENCRYTSLLLSSPSDQSLHSEDLMEALLWEGLTPFHHKHLNSSSNICQHDFITKFLKLTASNVGLARSEQIWHIKADLHGVESEGARYYHHLHDQLLSSRKNGYYLSELSQNSTIESELVHSLRTLETAEFLSPHYLSPSLLSMTSSNQHYHSTSILGKLSDEMLELLNHKNSPLFHEQQQQQQQQQRQQQLDLSSNDSNSLLSSTEEDSCDNQTIQIFSLDQNFQINFEMCCCFNEKYDDLKEKESHLIKRGLHGNISTSFDPLSIKSSYLMTAKDLFSRFVAELSQVFSNEDGDWNSTAPTSTPPPTAPLTATATATPTATTITLQRTQIILKYQQEFLHHSSVLYQQNGSCLQCIPETPRQYYLYNSALKLSSAVYEVSHSSIQEPITSRNLKLMLACWYLCGGYLLNLKEISRGPVNSIDERIESESREENDRLDKEEMNK